MATIISVIVAVPVSFLGAHNIMSRVRGGTVIYYLARAAFNITRSIDTLIWAIIFVVWVGLGAFAGLLALSLHSIAAVAKLYSEEIEHIDPGPVEAATAAGANLLQTVRFAVLPQIVPPFLAYSLLRWDINMRSATVVGFVSAAGVGFMIVESIRKGGYEIYAAALWCIAIVVIIVDFMSSYWRERILRGETVTTTGAVLTSRVAALKVDRAGPKPAATEATFAPAPVPFYKTPRGIFYTIAFLIVLVISWNLSQIELAKLLEPAPTFGKLILDFLSLDTSQSVWEAVLKAMLTTIFQALLATTLGGLIALPFAFLGARNITGRTRATVWVYYLARFILNFLRSIEAILYVAIFVFWVGTGAFAGMLALAVTTFGLIGKLFSEAVENIDEGPVEALTATGANRLQSIVYAILPQIVPPFISYAIYQWDINIRLATIIGFAGGGGVGLLFQNYVGQLQYHKAGAVIFAIVLVVTLMDLASAKIRERLV
jgi:phosphonate transport system permease protein